MNSTEPIAVTTGYYGGQATVKALDESLVLPVGLALYPQPAQQGVAYAALASHGQAPAQPEVVPECHYGPLRDADAEWGKQLSVYATLPRAADTQQTPAQAAPAAVAGPSDPSITLDFKMASVLLDMFGGEPGLVTLQHGGEKCHSGVGLYAWYSDLPEEGAEFLGAEPDDEVAPTAQPAPQQEAQEPVAWHVCSVNSDGSLSLEHAAVWEEAAHEHINDAITEHDIEGAGSWVVRPAYHAPQPSPAAQGDALDAARYRWLAASCRSTSEHWGGRWSIIIDGPAPKSHDSEDDFDAAIDAARARLEGKPCA